MAAIIDTEREKKVREFADGEFLHFERDPDRKAADHEVEIDTGWCLIFPEKTTPLLKKAEELFTSFCGSCMGVSFSTKSERAVHFKISEQNLGREDFILSVQEEKVEVRASHETGVLRGAMRILRIFADKKGPFLEKGEKTFSPAFNPRIANTVFCPAAQTFKNHEKQYSDDYLALMALFGINGIHVYIRLWDHCRTSILPELESRDFEQNMKDACAFRDRLACHGIDMYLHINTPALRENHPVFEKHPEIKGALTFLLGIKHSFCLCISSEKVLLFYEEAFKAIFSRISGLGGAVIIIGGECFMHCYTRPIPPLEGKTNCRQCSGHDPSDQVANLINRLAHAVKETSPSSSLFCWPYSAFTWSGPEDNSQLGLIERLSEDVSFLSNLDTGDFHPKSKAWLYDYNIVETGASKRFKAQSKALDAMERPHFAKLECSATPFMYHVPYLPLPYRWFEKAESLKKEKVAGFISHWRFFGFTGSLAEEILYESAWRDVSADEFLEQYCRREYGQFAPGMLSGWKKVSKSWDFLPYSAMLGGGREFYSKGPIYLGPAHPFIFDVQNNYGLKRGFKRVIGYTFESFEGDTDLEERRVPVYCSDLIWTWPMGVEKCIRALDAAASKCQKGAKEFKSSFVDPGERALLDIGLCEIIGIHFQTAVNLARFYQARDAFFGGGGDLKRIEKGLNDMQAILESEIENSERALPILERDERIGYGFCYGIVYDAEMVREKIEQCRYVLREEIPLLAHGMRFHLHSLFP